MREAGKLNDSKDSPRTKVHTFWNKSYDSHFSFHSKLQDKSSMEAGGGAPPSPSAKRSGGTACLKLVTCLTHAFFKRANTLATSII